MTEKNLKPIFLNNGTILPWERPLPNGSISLLHMYNGSTELKEFLCFEHQHQSNIGPYNITATAAKYLADIAILKGGIRLEEDPPNPPQKMLLFVGGITIYEQGKVPGTELDGLDLKTNGKIWYATKPTKLLTADGGLALLILGSPNLSEAKRIERIKRIILGYETQKENKERSESRARYEEYQRGQHDYGEQMFGTFGRR